MNLVPILLQGASLVLYTLGVPVFSILAIALLRRRRPGGALFRAFTVLCAIAFLQNLFIGTSVFRSRSADMICGQAVALLPPMMAHLVLQQQAERRRRLWQVGPWLLYLLAAFTSLDREWRGSTHLSPASPQMVLGAVASFCLAVLLSSSQAPSRAEGRHRTWNIILFATLLFAASASFVNENPFFSLLPDYVLLAFFIVWLYYTERLAFFDTLVKDGSYLALGASLYCITLLAAPPFSARFARDWVQASSAIFWLMPAWLVGPYLLRRVSTWTDKALHRRYSASEAERVFWEAVQPAVSIPQINLAAASSLRVIFDCDAKVVESNAESSPMAPGDLIVPLGASGSIHLSARTSQVPFLSADRCLLETLSANLGILLINASLRERQAEQLLREQQLAAAASRAELRALRAQINPHFLFNALNAIAGWIRTEPDFADETVAQLAEVFRYTLRQSESEWLSVEDEVGFLQAYLAVEQARFRDRLFVEVQVDRSAKALRIPAMLIQPLVENAIKHGISKVREGGRLAVTVALDPSSIFVTICDNGPGFPADFSLEEAGRSHGLWNVSERLKGYYSDRAGLRWSRDSLGNYVTLTLARRETP